MQLQIYDRNDGRYNKKRKNSAIWIMEWLACMQSVAFNSITSTQICWNMAHSLQIRP